ncbi:MAG TPA: redoxin domain-containing protein [Chloroflexota bacterium]|nr:redoxin domain-containing protein [Chloroflexota bacterium]
MRLPFRLRTISRVVIGVVIVASVLIIAYFATMPRKDQAAPPAALAGTVLNDKPAPAFRLLDQNGHPVNPRATTTRVTVVTFFYTHCPDTCPLTAQKLRHVIEGLGAQSHQVTVIAVTTDPLHDTPSLARRFLALHGLPQWHFVLGTMGQLTPVWAAYHVYAVSPTQVHAGPVHTAGMYLLDRRGRERAYLDDSLPGVQIAADIRLLLGDRNVSTAPPVAPHIGDAAPNFTLSTPEGSSLSLHSLAGRPALVNFWATWCGPCKTEMPLLERTYREYRGKFEVLGVDQQETTASVAAFIRAHHITYPIALDQGGNVAYRYEIMGTPTSFLLDRRGVIRYLTVGPLNARSLRREVARLVDS